MLYGHTMCRSDYKNKTKQTSKRDALISFCGTKLKETKIFTVYCNFGGFPNCLQYYELFVQTF